MGSGRSRPPGQVPARGGAGDTRARTAAPPLVGTRAALPHAPRSGQARTPCAVSPINKFILHILSILLEISFVCGPTNWSRMTLPIPVDWFLGVAKGAIKAVMIWLFGDEVANQVGRPEDPFLRVLMPRMRGISVFSPLFGYFRTALGQGVPGGSIQTFLAEIADQKMPSSSRGFLTRTAVGSGACFPCLASHLHSDQLPRSRHVPAPALP